MTISERVSTKYQPIKDAAGLHGKDIGSIGTGTMVVVDMDKEHDKWAPIVGPVGLGPIWLKTGKQGWIELANTNETDDDSYQYILKINKTTGNIMDYRRIK